MLGCDAHGFEAHCKLVFIGWFIWCPLGKKFIKIVPRHRMQMVGETIIFLPKGPSGKGACGKKSTKEGTVINAA